MAKTKDTTRSPPATAAEIAAIEFEPIEAFRGANKDERIRNTRGLCEQVHAVSIIATEIVALTKAELVAKVEAKYDEFGPALMLLARARESAIALLDIVTTAETRLAVALATQGGTQKTVEDEVPAPLLGVPTDD